MRRNISQYNYYPFIMQKSTMLKNEAAKQARQWYEIDATNVILGKLSVVAADLLRGKTKVNYTPHIDCGDYVIIKNANFVKVSANKPIKEFRYSHSGYIGGLRKRSVKEMLDKYADELVYLAVKGMVPKNRLGRQIMTKLKVYKDQGPDHSAQKPIMYKVQ